MDGQKTKQCCGCKKELPVEEFHKNKGAKDGLNTICKKCKSAYWHRTKKEDGRGKREEGSRKQPARGSTGVTPGATDWNDQPAPLRGARPGITHATPEEIIKALRRGVAEEIIQTVRERFGL